MKLQINTLFIILASLGLLAASCTSIVDPAYDGEMQSQEHKSNIRTVEEVIDIAEKSLMKFGIETKSGIPSRTINRSNVQVLYNTATKSLPHEDTLMYVVNFNENQGFALISADRRDPELLILTESGNFDGRKTESPAFNMYFQNILTELSQEKSASSTMSNDYDEMVFNRVDTTTNVTTSGELLVSAWHKYAPYSNYCTTSANINTNAGSGPVLLAKLLASFEYPTFIPLTFASSPTSTLFLNWDQMSDQNAALLIRELGELSSTNYNSSNVSTTLVGLQNCLQSLGYQCTYVQNPDNEILFEQIRSDNKILVYFRDDQREGGGQSVPEDEISIQDGKKTEIIKYTYYQRRQSETIWKIVGWEVQERVYLHYTTAFPNGEYSGYYIAKSMRNYGEGGRFWEPTDTSVDFEIKSAPALINIKPLHM
mgnify:CR=1 FL=1